MIQSMCRVGRCIDNGPMEALWGTLKAKRYYLSRFHDYDSMKAAIERCIRFYNTERFQQSLSGPALLEHRAFLQSAA